MKNLPALPDGQPPRSLALTNDISLIVAEVAADAYAADKVEARLADIDWVSRCGSAHHAVADTLVSRYTVVPVRPFTLFSSEANALRAFRDRIAQLEHAFDRVRGKAEWVVRIGRADPARGASAASTGQAARPSSGTAFLAEKAAARRRAMETVARVQRAAASVYDALTKAAAASERRSGEAANNLLLDAAFLVETRSTSEFKRAVEAHARELLDAGCRVSVTGPWPPYSFVALDAGVSHE